MLHFDRKQQNSVKQLSFKKKKHRGCVQNTVTVSWEEKSLHHTDFIFLMISVLFLTDLFIFFWLYGVFVAACGLSLVAGSGGYSLAAVSRLLIAVASLVAHRLSCHVACGVFPEQRLNPCPPH